MSIKVSQANNVCHIKLKHVSSQIELTLSMKGNFKDEHPYLSFSKLRTSTTIVTKAHKLRGTCFYENAYRVSTLYHSYLSLNGKTCGVVVMTECVLGIAKESSALRLVDKTP